MYVVEQRLCIKEAEAVGLTVPASKYRENMSNHFMYGDSERIAEHMQEFGDKA